MTMNIKNNAKNIKNIKKSKKTKKLILQYKFILYIYDYKINLIVF